MKKFLFFVMLFFSIVVQAQNPIEYSEVIPAEGMTADQIYQSVRKWFVHKFRDAQSVIQVDNPGEATIIGKGCFPFEYKSLTWASSSGCIWCVVDVKAKDGRFKISVSDFRHESSARQSSAWSIGLIYDAYLPDYKHQHKKIWDKVYPLCQSNYQELVESLRKFISENKESKQDDNW